MQRLNEPTLRISLDNLLHNLQQIRAISEPLKVIGVLKDSSYGIGSVQAALAIEDAGVDTIAVARVCEARTLKEGGAQSLILILGEASLDELQWGTENSIDFCLNSLQSARNWAESGISVRFHCNIDTGMHRFGIQPDEIDDLFTLLDSHPQLHCTGLFTHFACADNPNPDSMLAQQALFEEALKQFDRKGISPEYIHTANSAAIPQHVRERCTHVRPGIVLYGCKTDPEMPWPFEPKQVATLLGPVVRIIDVPANTPVSYCWNYRTPTATRIATVYLGYAHGVPRFLSNRCTFLINGQEFPIAGNVTMDYCMVDIGTEIAVQIGDEAVVMGEQGEKVIPIDTIASIGKTIGYEVLCHLGRNTRREYIHDGKVVHTEPCLIL